GGEEFPWPHAAGRALCRARPLLLACALSSERRRQRRALPRGGSWRNQNALVCAPRSRGSVRQSRPPVAAAARNPSARPNYASHLPPSAALPLHLRQKGGRALIPAPAPGSLLVIVPALNEEAAIGAVVRDIRQSVPGVPVLVIDDSSKDATISVARQAGAAVLPLPHHLGLGGCVQAGYKLA